MYTQQQTIPMAPAETAAPGMGDIDMGSFVLGGIVGYVAYAVLLYRGVKRYRRAHGPLRPSR